MRDNVSYGAYFTDIEQLICRSQGAIFEEAANCGYDILSFSRAYMMSAFCSRYFDTLWSYYQVLDPKTNLDILLAEVGNQVHQLSSGLVSAADVAFWVGYTYRQLYIGTGLNSAILYGIIPVEKLIQMYPGLHTISEDLAFERLCEDFGLQMRPEFDKVYQKLNTTNK